MLPAGSARVLSPLLACLLIFPPWVTTHSDVPGRGFSSPLLPVGPSGKPHSEPTGRGEGRLVGEFLWRLRLSAVAVGACRFPSPAHPAGRPRSFITAELLSL